MFSRKLYKHRGLSLVEVLIVAAIFTAFIGALVTIHVSYLNITSSGLSKVKATFLVEEGVEAVKLLRDQSWTKNIAAIPVDTNYYLSYNPATSFWATTTVNTYTDSSFERKFVLANVYRDVNSDIAGSGTLDPNTKKLTMYVSWSYKGATSTKTIDTYITNLFNN